MQPRHTIRSIGLRFRSFVAAAAGHTPAVAAEDSSAVGVGSLAAGIHLAVGRRSTRLGAAAEDSTLPDAAYPHQTCLSGRSHPAVAVPEVGLGGLDSSPCYSCWGRVR